MIPNAVSAAHYARPRSGPARPWTGKPFTLAIGEVKERKGHHLSLGAFCAVASRHPDLHHVLIGHATGDEYQRSLQELVRRAWSEAALELLLNEVEVARVEAHPSIARVTWSARTGREELTVAFAWRKVPELAFPLDLRWLLRAFTGLCRAVGALHERGWVHADLKPEAIAWGEAPEQLTLWDLRIAQKAGPRRYDAFSARFAAPEQVTGGDVEPRTDVYALGVTLYSLFIRGRFPAILVPTGGTLRASAAGTALSPITCHGDLGDLGAAGDGGTAVGGASATRDVQATLGAKLMFAAELERVIKRNTDIAVASELLRLIERASSQKPTDRFADANALAQATAALLALAEEVSGGA